MTILGIHHISLICANAQRTKEFYTQILGQRLVKQTVNFDDPSSYHLYFGNCTGQPETLIGVGITHHFAFAVADEENQMQWRDRLLAKRIQVTPVLDRQYFKSIFFHDPGGHVVEIATNGPGFCTDETEEHLGEALKLPEWLEHMRPQIESGPTPLR